MYPNDVNLSDYYTRDEVLAMIGKSREQFWAVRKKIKFPTPILIKCPVKLSWQRPVKSFFRKTEVDAWLQQQKGGQIW